MPQATSQEQNQTAQPPNENGPRGGVSSLRGVSRGIPVDAALAALILGCASGVPLFGDGHPLTPSILWEGHDAVPLLKL